MLYQKTKTLFQVIGIILLTANITTLYAQTSHDPAITPSTQGTLEGVSNHIHATPTLYHFADIPMTPVGHGERKKFVLGTHIMVAELSFKKGSVVPIHFHVNEQISLVQTGLLYVFSQGYRYILKPGDLIIIPANVPHKYVAKENTTLLTFDAPPRQDWLDKKHH